MAALGTKENPYKNKDEAIAAKKYFVGKNAITQVELKENITLNKKQKRVVELEGFVDGFYRDTKNILTYGTGQTEKYFNSGFKEAFKAHEDETKNLIPNYLNLNEDVQAELVQLAYRGDLQQSPRFRTLFNKGKYKEASQELLNHNEYNKLLIDNPNSGIIKRLNEAQDIFFNLGQNKQALVYGENTDIDVAQAENIMRNYYG